MKFQFSIAGLMAFTIIVVVALWWVSVHHLVATVASASLTSGVIVGWIIGAGYGQPRRTMIAGVVGALLWCSFFALTGPPNSEHFNHWHAWFALTIFGLLGATPMASVAAAIDRGADELISWPTYNCVLLVWICSVPVGLWLIVMSFHAGRGNPIYAYPASTAATFALGLGIATCVAAAVGAGYGLAGLFMHKLCYGSRLPPNR